MLYQSVLLGRVPYVARRMPLGTFRLHFHHEIELLYCLRGSFSATVDGIPYEVSAGKLLFIGSMKPHEIREIEDAEVFLIEFGPALLEEHFARLTALSFENPLLSLPEMPELAPVMSVLEEMVSGVEKYGAGDALMLLGNLYRFCALLLTLGEERGEKTSVASEHQNAVEIEKVLALIHTEYPRTITVEEAAELAGYGKSNFCKLFKSLMGVSFHSFLNSFRVENAKVLLRTTTASIPEIGEAVGLPDPKTFCRVFKANLGMSPGEYRKAKTKLPPGFCGGN